MNPSVSKLSVLGKRSLTSLVLVCRFNYHRDRNREGRRDACTDDLNDSRL